MNLSILFSVLCGVASADYFVTRGKFRNISNPDAICGRGNQIAMANTSNLSAFNTILNGCGITTAFVSGWNGESRVQLRFTVGAGCSGTVTPNNDCDAHHVLCSGDPTSCPAGVIAVGRRKVQEVQPQSRAPPTEKKIVRQAVEVGRESRKAKAGCGCGCGCGN